MLYLCSFLLRNLLAYAIGCHMLFCLCSRHAPKPSLLASHFTRVSQLMSKFFCSTIVLIACFILLNALVCISYHSNFLGVLFVGFVISGLSGALNAARFGMNFTKWCMLPINDLSCFSVFGFSS